MATPMLYETLIIYTDIHEGMEPQFFKGLVLDRGVGQRLQYVRHFCVRSRFTGQRHERDFYIDEFDEMRYAIIDLLQMSLGSIMKSFSPHSLETFMWVNHSEMSQERKSSH
jgi:hypothetical protein